MPKELAIVIPVYNEEAIIAQTFKGWYNSLAEHDIDFDLHVYNDGSSDSSLEALRKLETEFKNSKIHDKANSGHGPTILQGYIENSDYTWIFQTDSDNEMPPSSFISLWNKRNDYDFLIGKRNNRKQSLSRKIVSFISRLIVSIFYGNKVSDVNSPYRLMRTSCFKNYYEQIPKDTFAPNLIISGIASLKKLRVYETDVPHVNRKTGEVSIKKLKLLKAAMKAFLQTIAFRFKL